MHEAMVEIARRAGEQILEVYATAFDVDTKADDSPLTQADLRAHEVIVEGLRKLDSSIPIISEESDLPAFSVRRGWHRYWLVDPLDGTKEFVSRNGEFTTNVALIEDHRPVLGVVGVPVQDRIFVGDVKTGVAYCIDAQGKRPLEPRQVSRASLTVVASRSHGGERLEAYIDALRASFGEVERKPVGSSLKLCILAEGQADFYPRLGPTSEWDIGAAQAVLEAAGGAVTLFDGAPLAYNTKESFLNPEFMAVADARFPWHEHLPALPDA